MPPPDDPPRFRRPSLTTVLRRREDQLRLEFDFYNLRVDGHGNTAVLERGNRDQDAYVVVRFPPQHVMEEAGYEYDKELQRKGADPPPNQASPDPTPDAPIVPQVPVGSRLAGPSRLAFRIPKEVQSIPYTPMGLLDWRNWIPSLVPVAHGPGTPAPDFVEPGRLHTAIELPWWLILSPNPHAGWDHSPTPVTRDGRTELWHTRLTPRDGVDPADAMRVRAVWMRDPDLELYLLYCPPSEDHSPIVCPPDGEDFVPPKPGMPFRTALSPRDRFDLVICTADFAHRVSDGPKVVLGAPGGPIGPGYVPQPAEANRLMLSTLGGWLDAHGAWDPQDVVVRELPFTFHSQTSLESWRHDATLGRDHYVRIVRRGFLFPFGFAASLVKVTERKFRTIDRRRRAYNFQRYFIIVRRREVEYGDNLHENEGRAFPFSKVVTHTMITPNLDPPGEGDDPVGLGLSRATDAFVPRVHGKPFRFHVVGTDQVGRSINLHAPVVFVNGEYADKEESMPAVINAYNGLGSDDPARTIDLEGAAVAVAEVREGEPRGETDLEIHRFTLGAEPPSSYPDFRPGFRPTMWEAEIRLAAAEAVLGTGAGNPVVKFNQRYLDDGFNGQTAGEVFVELVGTSTASVDFGGSAAGDRCGGVITPNIEVRGLSRLAGPVGGDLDEYQDGNFTPEEFFPTSATLLGDITLGDVVKPATPGASDALSLTTRELSGPDRTVTELVWHPKLRTIEPFFPTYGNVDATLAVRATITTPKNGAQDATFVVLGDLRSFQIKLLNSSAHFMTVAFHRLRFQSETGKKTDVDVEIAKVEFAGPLQFVNKLKDYLSFSGSGFDIDLLPTHLEAGFTLPIPNISVGVFSISNIAFGAGVIIPFTGKPLRFRFGFSARENMFQLSVMIFGGGGFFELEIGPAGVEALQLALEFGVTAAIDVGVASGRCKIVAGIYLALGVETEQNPGGKLQLTGYLTLEGKVKIFGGVVSVTVRMEAAFTYYTGIKKAVVKAEVLLEVKVFGFGPTLKAKFERRFGGSSDPTFGDTLTQGDWDAYADAFAPIAA